MVKVTPIFRHWYWLWLISALFVAAMVVFFLTKYPPWFHYLYRGVSLSHEMSYGVWWSSICLFLAAIIFANVGKVTLQNHGKSWPWLVLSLGMLALCFDEVGSLHETVSRVAGWKGLIPFGLVLSAGFGIALIELLRNPSAHLSAFLVILGLGIFGTVVGLEVLEHDLTFQHPFWRRARQVGEEASELIAMGLLVTAGLVAMKRMGDGNREVINATSVVAQIKDYPLVMFLLFILHTAFTAAVIIPNYSFFPEGNPSALFPMLLFFCLGLVSAAYAGTSESAWLWRTLSILFIVTSMAQLYNIYVLFENGLNRDPLHSPWFIQIQGFDLRVGRVFADPPISWGLTMLPYVVLGIHKVRKGVITMKQLLLPVLLLFVLYMLLYPDLDLRFRVEYLYFLFSGGVAWSCYRLMFESENP